MYEICIFFTYVSSLWDKYDWFQVRGKIMAPLLSKTSPEKTHPERIGCKDNLQYIQGQLSVLSFEWED